MRHFLLMREGLLLVTAASAALAAGVLAARRLWSAYPELILYLIVESVQDLILTACAAHPRQYFYVWTVFQFAGSALGVAMTFAMTSQLVRRYWGIALVARWFYLGATLFSSLVALAFGWAGYQAQSATELAGGLYSVNYLAVYSRLVFSVTMVCTVIFMMMLGGFLLWFPIRISRSTFQHYVIFLIYMLAGAAGYLITRTATAHSNIDWMSGFLALISVGCYLAWAKQLRPEVQDTMIQTVHFGPSREQQLNLQLEYLNEVVLRSLGTR